MKIETKFDIGEEVIIRSLSDNAKVVKVSSIHIQDRNHIVYECYFSIFNVMICKNFTEFELEKKEDQWTKRN